MADAVRNIWQILLLASAGLVVGPGVPAAVDPDPEAAPPADAPAAVVTGRPTVSTTPPKLKFGKTKEEQAEQFRAWLLKAYPKLDPNNPAVDVLVQGAVSAIVAGEGGESEIHAGTYGYKSGKFNECQALAETIYSIPAPREYRDEVVRYYAWGLIDQRWAVDLEGEKARLGAIAPSDNVVRIKPGGKLRPHIEKAFPGLTTCTPLMQKLVFDYVAGINPNTVEPQGWYRSAAASVGVPDDCVALPVGNGRFQVCRYVVKPDAPILIPAPASLVEAANPKKLNLRGYWISSLTELAGLTPVDLDISYTQIRDISGLARMKSLRRLSIAGLPVSDLAPIAVVVLDALDVSETAVREFSAIKGMRLRELRADRTGIVDLGPLKGMPLEILSIEQTDVSDLSPLAGMPLEYLNVDMTRVRNLSPLAGMPLREVLYAPGGYEGVAVLREIKTLQVIGFHPADQWRTEFDKKHLRKGITPGGGKKGGAVEDELGLGLD